jgi:hypothetical protein
VNKKLILFACGLITYGVSGIAGAQTPTSTSYQLPESFIGPGGTINSTSAHYSESSTAGDLGTGTSSSSSFQTQAGFNTTAEPRLTVIVDTSSVSFGALSTSVAKTATSTFKVLNYTSSGYKVYTVGNTPTNGGHNLTGMSPAAASQVGVEQYGMNLKANTSPTTFGAEPVQVPSSSFSYGAASTGYATANNFRYVAGEEIANAPKTSGETDYTISYIVNIATTTPGGVYSGSQSLVVVGTY